MLTFTLLAVLVLAVIAVGVLAGIATGFWVADIAVCGMIIYGIIKCFI